MEEKVMPSKLIRVLKLMEWKFINTVLVISLVLGFVTTLITDNSVIVAVVTGGTWAVARFWQVYHREYRRIMKEEEQ
ncbi:MAG: hypothetical protein M3M85_00105 [bacterium]|nr:hypothetical protein [bacterium]